MYLLPPATHSCQNNHHFIATILIISFSTVSFHSSHTQLFPTNPQLLQLLRIQTTAGNDLSINKKYFIQKTLCASAGRHPPYTHTQPAVSPSSLSFLRTSQSSQLSGGTSSTEASTCKKQQQQQQAVRAMRAVQRHAHKPLV